jgi:D-3-phosphoglycerate dehydrogenase
MKVKILIADKFPEKYVEEFKSMDLDVNYSPKLGENDLPAAAKDTDILIVRSTIVNAETIKSATNLNLIIRAGAGVNNIDISTANQQGIYVANCPGKNSVAVAELALG